MKVHVITQDDDLASFWPEWDRIWARVPGATPFQSPAWMRAWWQVFGSPHPIVAIATTSSGACGLLPLYRYQDKLLPMGVGITDYLDLLLTPDAPPEAAAALLAAALQASRVTRCDLPDLPVGAALRLTPPPAGWADDTWSGAPCPELTLRETLALTVPKSMLRDLRQARHRAERAGGARYVTADRATLPHWLDTLATLHGARWEGRGETGVLADPAVRRFHALAAPALLEAGLLRLVAVELDGRPAGVVLALRDRERLYFYLGAFDPARRYESPGTLLIGHMLEQAIDERLTAAHFLRGGEAYKYRWGAIDRHSIGRSLVRR
ncbi:MAG: GNAT family N-acetyltransferase [Rhodospirillales bacterium]|nr:GNAT family N-acetyltransferase [Rhodospirillales bacterium]